MQRSRTVRSIFLSDIHLGSRHCQADLVKAFLDAHEAEKLYLVGDIIDGWQLKKSWYWPASHEAVVQHVLQIARRGTEVYYIPGNHDEFVRTYAGRLISNVAVRREMIHRTMKGRIYLITHGDKYDPVIQKAKWLAHFGSSLYELALSSNTALNWARRRFGMGYWSLGKFAKRHVKSFIGIIGEFEAEVIKEVRAGAWDGVICGHIHHAVSRDIEGVHYLNAGDWVESCSAIVEDLDGELSIRFWRENSIAHPAYDELQGEMDHATAEHRAP